MKPEKVEPRGKYPGTKIHLGKLESQLLIDLAANPTPKLFKEAGELSLAIGKKLTKLLVEFPNMLKERTQAEIKAELQNEYESAKQKLAAMGKGENWKDVKVPK